MIEMDYKQILDRLVRKDREGLEALYNSYGQKLYQFAVKRWLLGEDEAWDVVYKTLEKLLLKLPEYTFESEVHFNNFIFKVFTNFLRQAFRDDRKKKVEITELTIDTESYSYGEEEDEPETGTLESLDLDKQAFRDYYEDNKTENPRLMALNKALEQLSEQDRDILLLRAQNYSYDEIAAMLKIENKQLKVRHHRCKAKLIELIYRNKSHEE